MSYDAASNYTVDHGDGSESAEELGKYELWLVPHAVGNFLLASFDRVFISNNFGESLVREFVILSQIFSLLALIPVSFNRIILPRIFDNEVDFFDIFKSKLVPLIALFFLLCCAYGSIIFFIGNYFFAVSLNLFVVCILMTAMQFFNSIYLVSVSIQHKFYAARWLSTLTILTAILYIGGVLSLTSLNIVNILLIAVLGQFVQTLAVVWDLNRRLSK